MRRIDSGGIAGAGTMLGWGTPLGPGGLIDSIRLDVVRDIEEVTSAIDSRARGVETGRGIYAPNQHTHSAASWRERASKGQMQNWL